MASSVPSVHQRKFGPAPIASFEDLSDEVENGGEAVARMPGIVEVTTPVTAGSLKTPSTPRIDISRASSSSHHDDDSNSRESTPEKELLAGTEPPEGCTLQLGYKENAQELRSSTEELDLQDPVHEQDQRRDSKRLRKRAKEVHDGTQSEHGSTIKVQTDRERKDSNCSEIILLNISGRTSRLSSVGSQGSGVSGGALSVVSANSSRSPSPHKCLLETSFCGSVSTLANTLIEPSKPETDDLAKILLQREEDSTKAMIPDNVRVPMVGGNLKPDPLDMPRRRGREERKEIFKREVEITKKVLKRVNIEVPIIKLPKQPDDESNKSEVQKPVTLDLNDMYKTSLNTSPSRSGTSNISSEIVDSPKLSRHQKVRDLEGSRTPSPSSISRKSSFASLFKSRIDDTSIQSQDSPTSSSRRTSLANRLKDTAESLRSRSKSREGPSSSEKSPGGRRPESRGRSGSGVFSSTLSLFKKRERKKSGDESTGTPDTLDDAQGNLNSIGCVEFAYNKKNTPTRRSRKEDVIFISLYGDNDEFRNQKEPALAVESIEIPLDDQTNFVDENDVSSPQQTSVNIVCTDATIEHHRRSRRNERRNRESARISSSSGDSMKMPECNFMDSQMDESKDLIVKFNDIQDSAGFSYQPPSENRDDARNQRMSTSSSRDSICKKPDIVKPERKSKKHSNSSATKSTSQTSHLSSKIEVNGKISDSVTDKENPKNELFLPENSLSKTPSVNSDLDHNSSESERDSEIDFIRNKAEKGMKELPDERKGLCYDESFEEDLPYVPTTLPLEKSVAIPMLPVKQRLQDVRTTPIERPRSTTPINPTLLDEFIMHTSHDDQQRYVDKMKISLPREDSFKLKSPHRPPGHNSFSEFAGRVSAASRGLGFTKSPSPPPLPPRAPTTVLTTVSARGARPVNWINFEEIPEKRKPAKRIQTIPRLEENPRIHSQSGAANVAQYSYVQPEECRCECHEESRRASMQRDGADSTRESSLSCSANARSVANAESSGNGVCNGENCPASSDRSNVVSDNSSSQPNRNILYMSRGHAHNRHDNNASIKPFAMDLDVSSNRSSIVSQEETEDEHV